MGHSSLFGAERAAPMADGRDVERLGTGDNSDSGSDLMGLDSDDQADPGLPVDVALSDDAQVFVSADSLPGSSGDASGTGERRAAAGDSGREAADIGVDRVFSLAGDGTERDDEDADLAFIDDAVSMAERDAAADAADDEADEAEDADALDRAEPASRRNPDRGGAAYDRAVATPENPDDAGLDLDDDLDDDLDEDDDEGVAGDTLATERRPPGS